MFSLFFGKTKMATIMLLTFGSELILELNEDKGRLGGVEFECHGR